MAGMIRNARMGVKLVGCGGTTLLLVGAMAITTYLGVSTIGEKVAIMHRASGVAESAGEAPKVASQADLHATPATDLNRLSAFLAMYGKVADEAVLATQHNNELWFGQTSPLRLSVREDLTSTAAAALVAENVSDAGNQGLESLMLVGALILGLVIVVNLIFARLAVNSITVLTGVMRDMAGRNSNVDIPASGARNARKWFGNR